MKDKKYCQICRKEQQFAESESPKGYFICGNCGFRTSFGKMKLIENKFGYNFEYK